MDISAAALIALGAFIGLYMLTNLLKGHHIPKALSLIHGALVITGLLLLITFNLRHPDNSNWTSAVLFILATFGGIYILFHDIKHEKVPLFVIFLHGVIALSGFAILLYRIIKIHH